MTVGILGLGLVGAALAERLLAAGYRVAGYDLLPERRAILTALGGEACTTPEALAEAVTVLLVAVLTTDQASAALTPLPLAPGTLVLDMTTGDPDAMAALGAELEAREIGYCDTTIAGSSADVRAGTVLVLAGGDPEHLDRAQPILRCFAQEMIALGPVGSGARMKLVFNLVLGLQRAVLAEGLAFAEALDLDPAQALAVLSQGATAARVMATKGPKMLAADYTPVARLAQHAKDVALIRALAARTGASVPLTDLHATLLARLCAAGWGDADNAAIREAFAAA